MGPRSPTSPTKPKTPTFPDISTLTNGTGSANPLKPCAVCELPRSVLVRCQIDASGDWVYVCPVVCLARVGGVGPGNDGTKVGLYGSPKNYSTLDNANPHYRFGGLWNADKEDGEAEDDDLSAVKGRGKKVGAVKGVKARSLSWDDGTMGAPVRKKKSRQGSGSVNEDGEDGEGEVLEEGEEEGGSEDETGFKERDREPRRMKRRLSRKQRNTKFEDSFVALTTFHDEGA